MGGEDTGKLEGGEDVDTGWRFGSGDVAAETVGPESVTCEVRRIASISPATKSQLRWLGRRKLPLSSSMF